MKKYDLHYHCIASQDYSSVSEVVTFLSGERLKNVSIPITDDLYAEPTQYFSVSIVSLEDEGEVVFPITETVIKIIDNDGESTSDGFLKRLCNIL